VRQPLESARARTHKHAHNTNTRTCTHACTHTPGGTTITGPVGGVLTLRTTTDVGRPVAAAIVLASAPDCTAPLNTASAAAVDAGVALESANWTVRSVNAVSARARRAGPPPPPPLLLLLLPVSSYTARIVTVTPGVGPATAATNAARAAESNDATVRPVSETTTAAAPVVVVVPAVRADSGAGPHRTSGGAHMPAASAREHVPSGARHPPCVPPVHASHALHCAVPAAQEEEPAAPSTYPLQAPVTGSWHVPAPPAAHPPHAAGTPLDVRAVTCGGPAAAEAAPDAPSHDADPSGHPPQGSAGQHTPSPECTHGPALPSAQSQLPVGVGVAVGLAVAVGHTGAAAAPAHTQPDTHAAQGTVLVQ
jgi:hypothetical protein